MNNRIVCDHNAGFFSCCTVRMMRIVDFYKKNKIYPIVDSSNQWGFYKDKPGDITNLFFKEKSEEREIDTKIGYYDQNDSELSDYKLLDFKNLNFLVEKYFSPSDEVIKIYNYLVEKYKIDFDKTIAVCYRGNDKQKETNIPTYSEMMEKIDELVSKFPDHKLLIQSDEIDFYENVMKKYPNIIYFKEVVKIKKDNFSAVQYNIPAGERTSQAMIFLAIVNLLSKCSKLILNSGNVSMWITLYRGTSNNVYQYLNHKSHIYGVPNERYGTQTEYWIEN
jgi:hypothetical protein